jgi:hypothetical protein
MQTIEGLNALIKNRLIEKKGNVKLSHNSDIVSYAKALNISENQLLFKVLDISEKIDWSKIEKQNSSSPTIKPITLICKNCNTANEKGLANFCVECGTELKEEPIDLHNNINSSQNENSKNKYIITNITIVGIIAVVGIIASVIFYYSKPTENNQTPSELNTNLGIDSTEVENNHLFIDDSDSIHSGQISNEEALSKMTNYYDDINSSRFNAENYFSENVLQFITKTNLTPSEINTIFSQNNEFIDGKSIIVYDHLLFERTENNISYYSYWIDYSCFRKSKNKYQSCNVKAEVGFDQYKKIASYKELKIQGLKYQEIINKAESIDTISLDNSKNINL